MKKITLIVLTIALVACAARMHRGPEIRDRLSDTPGLAAHNISIDEERAGVISLNGNVSSAKDRETIERVARNTNGVSEVRNNLVIDSSSVAVREGYDSASSDSQISQNVREALRGRTDIDLRNVDITTRDAVVTLRGYQESNRDIDNLISSTRTVRGVRDVRNELTLNNRGYNDPYPRR